MELFLLYVWMKLGAFTIALIITALITLVVGVAFLFHEHSWNDYKGKSEGLSYAEYKENHWKVNLPKFWRNLWIAAIMIFTALAIPTQNQVAVLVGTHYALEPGKSPEGQKIVSLVRAKANNYLDEQLKELVEENKPKEKK
jgi:uncharacterized membrane protein